jgi:hypothetical protein
MSSFTEHPPVPQALKEALKDHPELIAELAEGLKMVGRAPGMSKAQLTEQLEAAVWALEGDLDDFFARAAAAAKSAEATGDVALIEKAKAKRLLMFSSRNRVSDAMAELEAFFH